MGFVRHLTGETSANAAKHAGVLQSDAATLNAEQLEATGQTQEARLGLAGSKQLNALSQGADAASRGLNRAGREASGLFDPYAQLGQQGVDQAGFLTDPNAQFDFLQNNPLFQMGLDNANTQTNQMAAARGRLSAGDTMQQLNQNAMLVGQPMIADQKNAIQNQLTMGQNAASQQANIGQNTALNQANISSGLAGGKADIIGNTALNQANLAMGNQANVGNLLGSAAAATAAGHVAAKNAKAAGAAGLLNVGAGIVGGMSGAGMFAPDELSIFSDPSLKDNIIKIGVANGHNIYSWDWNDKAYNLGLAGSSSGVMADEVKAKNPEAITMDRGFMKVNYGMLGVNK